MLDIRWADGKGVPCRLTLIEMHPGEVYILTAERKMAGRHREVAEVRLGSSGNTSDVMALVTAAYKNRTPTILPILADALDDDGDTSVTGYGLAWLTKVLRTAAWAGVEV